MKKKTSLFVLLAGSTLSSYAQTIGPETKVLENREPSPWSVGLQVTTQRYQIRYPITGSNEIGIIPVQVVTGYRATPRLLFQLGAAYRKNSATSYLPVTATTGFKLEETYHNLAIPLTARYTASRNIEKRLLLDVVGGLGVVYSKHNYMRITDTTPRTVEPTEEGTTRPFVTFGFSGRYRFTNHLEGIGDALLNRTSGSRSTFNPSFYNVAMGVRYNF